ncbi:ethanolamine ammonia-lyase subunit EutC [Silvibacterium acidisoli]|uniref:ethanolamine ammonia-lyase subunit EutC n=1 Tax=Acidobacteriaceae bacterium ZG23-2 TaxID=2883246 RepID=UPI00406CF45B
MSEELDRLSLRTLTSARIGLQRAGSSLATREALDSAASLAEARDAVHASLSVAVMQARLEALCTEVLRVKSAAQSRSEYLKHPALGRQLNAASRELLNSLSPKKDSLIRIVFAVADGLSALAAERHAVPLLGRLLPNLKQKSGITCGPIVLAEQARVALGDEIGSCLGADLMVMLIGERPGLSSPDSLGAYLTWSPRRGRTDAERNCISNIRTEGLDCERAAQKLATYISHICQARLSGTSVKEPAGSLIGP